MIRVAVDAMGGDFGCEPIVNGTILALKEAKFEPILVGKKSEIEKFIPSQMIDKFAICDADEVFSMANQASRAIKNPNTSIYKAIDLLKNGECNAVVSAGHSGATMGLATLKIGRLNGVLRPAIATLMPNTGKSGTTLVLDVGANVDCKPEHLYQFAIMGEIYAKEILGRHSPKIGLLSNGEEDCKGNELTKSAFSMLKKMQNFTRNVEGGEIFDGSVDVVICDGFIGNLVLKTSEGVAVAVKNLIKSSAKKSALSMLGAVLMKNAFKTLKKTMSYDEYGGAPLLGVKNCVIISHGKSSPKAIKNAIFQAIKFSDSKINSRIENEILGENQ